MVQVGGHDLLLGGGARAVGGGNGGGAGLRVPGDVPVLAGAGHGDCVDGGRVAVTVTIILQLKGIKINYTIANSPTLYLPPLPLAQTNIEPFPSLPR